VSTAPALEPRRAKPAPRAPAEPQFPRLARAAPVLAAALIAALYLAVEPRTVDYAAHVYRSGLFDREGFTIWNGNWYAGHHTVAYSVVFPPLAWLVGPVLVGAVSAVASALLFDRLARARWGERARWGSLWFGAGTGALLFTGRLPFALGVAFGLGALLALQRGRIGVAALLAVLASLSSPVAGLFLALAALAAALAALVSGGRRAALPGAAVAAAAIAPPVLLALAFPEGGHEPFVLSAFLPLPVFGIAAALVLPRRERALRIGALMYAAAGIAAYLIDTPMGGNAVRLGALAGGPVLLCALTPIVTGRRRALVAAGLVALGVWQWSPAVRDVVKSIEDPSAKASYYEPLLDFLERHPPAGRVEIPFTRSHWEAAEVAREFPLARGWQRQLDIGRHPIFYGGVMNDLAYANWLTEHAVHYVALPSVKPDYSSYRERALVEREPPYLRLVMSHPDWRVYEVRLPHPVVIPDDGARVGLARLASDEVALDFTTPGSALVRVSWTPYWHAEDACVERAGDWTRVSSERPGRVRLGIRFSPARMVARGRRCG